MPRIAFLRAVPALLPTFLLVLPSGEVLATAKEAQVIVITRWNSHCDASNRTPWDNMLRGWYNDITDTRSAPRGHGSAAWYEDAFWKNGNIGDSYFTDLSLAPWGRDHRNDRLDAADAAMIGLHGTHTTSGPPRWIGEVRVDENGSANCWAFQGHMELGDTDLEFLHVSSCHGMCDFDGGVQLWNDTFKGLHQINGFYGITWISSTYTSRYTNFADDGFDVGLADAWVDNQYSGGFWTGGHDHCPVSMVCGNSTSNAVARAGGERYNNIYSDPTPPYYFYYVSVSRCDPKGHTP